MWQNILLHTFLYRRIFMAGTFYGIGVGPGDPELLTMKAIKAIENADVLIAPKTEKKDGSVALSIAKPYLKKDIEIVYQVFPMVVNFETTDAWQKNKEEILSLLQSGKNVVFLTLGDPMFYSTYIYVYRLLAAEKDINIETIPGVPAFCAIGSNPYTVSVGKAITFPDSNIILAYYIF